LKFWRCWAPRIEYAWAPPLNKSPVVCLKCLQNRGICITRRLPKKIWWCHFILSPIKLATNPRLCLSSHCTMHHHYNKLSFINHQKILPSQLLFLWYSMVLIISSNWLYYNSFVSSVKRTFISTTKNYFKRLYLVSFICIACVVVWLLLFL